MFSLRATLDNRAMPELSSGSHPPLGFDPKNGIRSLFPRSYSGSIKILNTYVFVNEDLTTASGVQAFIGADGAGRWFFGWANNADAELNPRYQAGFVFRFSNDVFGHDYVDTSRPPIGSSGGTTKLD